MAWENLDNNACPLLFFLGLFFHRNRSTCRRVRHPWLLDWTVGTRYQKNWETRLFFFRNMGIYFHRRYRVESESEIADWQGETSDPWLLDWIWENWDTTCPRLLFFLDLFFTVTVRRYHVESQSHMVRSQTRSRVRHRSVAPGLDSKNSKMHIAKQNTFTCWKKPRTKTLPESWKKVK